MSEKPGHNLDGGSNFIDKSQKELTPDQAFLRLSRLLNAHNARIDNLKQLKPEQKEQLKLEVKTFLMESLRNSLYEPILINGKPKNVLAEYNASATDTNREIGLDSYEFTRYVANLEEALKLIVELGGVNKFRSEMGLMNKEAYEATTLKMDLFGDRDEKSPITRKFSEWYGKTVNNLTPEQIKDYTSTQFRGDKEKFVKGLAIAIGTELGPEAVEIAVNFVYDLGKAIMQLPEYFYFGFQFNRSTTETGKKEYSLKMKSRLDDNMALGLLALVYDGTADITQNLLGANISADAKGSRVRELIHNIGSPDTWTPAGIKEAIIGLIPFLRSAGRFAGKTLNSARLGEAGKPVQKPNGETANQSNTPEIKTPPPPPDTRPKTPPVAPQSSDTHQAKHHQKPPQTPTIQSNQQNNHPQLQNTKLQPQTPSQANNTLAGAVGTTLTEPIHRSNNGEVSKDNPKTTDLNDKFNSPQDAVVKERKVKGETIKFSPDEYMKAYKEGLEKVGHLLSDVQDWVLMSSNALYMNLKDYKMLPDDFDVVIRDRDFKTVYQKLHQAQKEGGIRDLEIHSIDDSYKGNVVDPKIQQQLFEAGNIKIVFNIDTANAIPMEVELFPEGKGKGLTQLGTIPRTIESFILNGKEIKVSGLFDLSDTYTINLMNELLKNSAERFGEKAKDATRVYNLTHYLKKTGINNPRDLITKMDEVVAKYKEHGGADLAPGLNGIFGELPKVKEVLTKIIDEYEARKDDFDGAGKTSKLPEFQEFIEEWNGNKSKLHKLYLETLDKKPLSKERASEIEGELKGYMLKTQSVMDKSLNNEDFAFFYEMSIIRLRYIKVIRDEMASKPEKNIVD